MTDLKYLEIGAVVAIHQSIIENSGGGFGIRDKSRLVSALQRPINLKHYCPESNIFEVAATLVSGIVINHPFVDGNKRCGLMCGLTFLRLNGIPIKKLEITHARAIMINLAMNKISDIQIANFLKSLSLKTL